MGLHALRVTAQVFPHREFLEVEHADRGGLDDAPAGDVLHLLVNRPQITGQAIRVFHVERVLDRGRQLDPELGLKQLREAMVGKNVVFLDAQCVLGFDGFAVEADLNEEKRGEQFFLRVVSLEPPEETKRREQRGHAVVDLGFSRRAAEPGETGRELAVVEFSQKVSRAKVLRLQALPGEFARSSAALGSRLPRFGS